MLAIIGGAGLYELNGLEVKSALQTTLDFTRFP